MGTPSGLYRYDGYFFTTFKSSETGNGSQLYNKHIIGLYNAGGDRLVIAQQGNLYSVYDTRQDRFLEMPEAEKRQLYAQCRNRPSTMGVEHLPTILETVLYSTIPGRYGT